MKGNMRIVLFIFIHFVLFSTYGTVIKGRVLDSETREPISFARASLGDMLIVTNIDGDFSFNLSTTQTFVYLKISAMGYNSYKHQITLNTDDYEVDIYLEKSVNKEESSDEKDDNDYRVGKSIMHKVFNRFYLNYEYSRQHLIGYYREMLYENKDLSYIAEGIVDIFLPIEVDEDYQPFVSPIKTRKKHLKEIDIDDLLQGHAGDMAQSSVWRKSSFLSEKNRINYKYSYAGVTELDNQKVHIINFEPKNKYGYIYGTMYIQDVDFAIIKMVYYPEVHSVEIWDEVKWVEEYKLDKGLFKLFRTSFDGTFSKDEISKKYSAILMVNKSERIDEFPIADYIDSDDLFYEKASDNFSENFWEGYNFIKLDLQSTEKVGGE